MLALSFDFGTKKIGVAIGEKITKTARSVDVLTAKNGYPNWSCIEHLLKYWQPTIIIVGLPLNINGTKQKITKKAEYFANRLKHKFNVLVELHDERLSTVEAKSIIFDNGGFKALKKNKIDSVAAAVILESWFTKN